MSWAESKWIADKVGESRAIGFNTLLHDFLRGSTVNYPANVSNYQLAKAGDVWYVFGGTNIKNFYAIDFKKQIITPKRDLPYVWVDHNSSFMVWNDELYVYGLNALGNLTFGNIYKYDAETNTWNFIDELPSYDEPYTIAVYNNELYAINTSVLYVYRNSTWMIMRASPYTFKPGSIIEFDGELHILGSQDSNFNTFHYAYNGSTWREVSTLPESLAFQNKAFICKDTLCYASARKIYAYINNSWELVDDNAMPFSSYPVASDNTLVYAANGTQIKSRDIFDPKSKWGYVNTYTFEISGKCKIWGIYIQATGYTKVTADDFEFETPSMNFLFYNTDFILSNGSNTPIYPLNINFSISQATFANDNLKPINAGFSESIGTKTLHNGFLKIENNFSIECDGYQYIGILYELDE